MRVSTWVEMVRYASSYRAQRTEAVCKAVFKAEGKWPVYNFKPVTQRQRDRQQYIVDDLNFAVRNFLIDCPNIDLPDEGEPS